ncbi:hypothetical protein ACLB2K_005846 [Fragaria x ananassa]
MGMNALQYRGDHHEAEVCPTCTTSRYKIGKNGVVRDGVAAKVLWYFPIIPRFKRMFQSPTTAVLLSLRTWLLHMEQRLLLQQLKQRKIPIQRIQENEDLDNLPPNLPKALLDLCNWANTFLKEGKTVNTVFQADLFGHPKKAYICRADVYSIAHKKEVSNSALFFYMSYLNKVLKQKKMEDMIQFVDSDKVSPIGSGTPTARSRDLSVMYKNGKPGQIYLIPYNTGSIKMYTGLLRKQPGKKKASPWKPLLGALIQKDDVSCGYYVMRYMKEIVEDNNIDLDKKWGTRAGLTYTAEDIDEIRGEWAEHVLQFPDQ